MTQSATKLSIIFFIALFADISMIFFQLGNLQIFTKPSLMLILLVWFCVSARNLGSTKYLIIFALVFSCFGDVFLLFEKQNPNLFIFGLGSFLIAHFFYIGYFYQIRKQNGVDFVPKILVFLGIVIYLVSLLTLILPYVTDIQIPVIIYATTLAAMLLTSFHAFEFNKHSFGKICVAGTLIFVVSDSIISINRFYQPLEFASIYIMLTYGIAQFLITIGAFQNLEKISHELSE